MASRRKTPGRAGRRVRLSCRGCDGVTAREVEPHATLPGSHHGAALVPAPRGTWAEQERFMAMPRKGSRLITVADVVFRWRIH
ncbi:hypothetical protein ACWDUI_38795, partial [Streptosporangium sandarakinum]